MGQGNEDISKHELLQTQKCEALVVCHKPPFWEVLPDSSSVMFAQEIRYSRKFFIATMLVLVSVPDMRRFLKVLT